MGFFGAFAPGRAFVAGRFAGRAAFFGAGFFGAAIFAAAAPRFSAERSR